MYVKCRLKMIRLVRLVSSVSGVDEFPCDITSSIYSQAYDFIVLRYCDFFFLVILIIMILLCYGTVSLSLLSFLLLR